MPNEKKSSAANDKQQESVKAITANLDAPLSDLKVRDLMDLITVNVSTAISKLGGSFGSHVNSGPTHHSNVPGHANFTEPGGRVGAHANSGPTHHSNVPGHANFSRVGDPFGLPSGLVGGSHVNSGPTGHSNVPGHANFTMPELSDKAVLPAIRVTLESGIQVSIPEGGPREIDIAGTKITRK